MGGGRPGRIRTRDNSTLAHRPWQIAIVSNSHKLRPIVGLSDCASSGGDADGHGHSQHILTFGKEKCITKNGLGVWGLGLWGLELWGSEQHFRKE